jgi:hypothetical protein
MSKPQTQGDMILAHLKKHRAITPLEALHLYGCFRLGARILELRQAGHAILTEIVQVTGKSGIKHVAQYRLAGKGRP